VKEDFAINHMQAFEWCSDDHENNGVFDNQHFLVQITPCCSHTVSNIRVYIRIYAYIYVYPRIYSQFRVIRGCHVKGVRVQIRFIHLLETEFLLILQY